MKLNRLITIFLLASFLLSCNSSEECREETEVKLTIDFMTRTYDNNSKTYKNAVLIIDSLTVKGLDSDSLIYNNSKKVKSIALPLRIGSNETAFEIRFNDITDTLYLHHSNNDQYFISLECGCVVTHEILGVSTTAHFSDSIIINNKDVNNIETTHIQIFN
jgi:hypothetical protein